MTRNAYCTIVSDGSGTVEGRYATKERALAAAKRLRIRRNKDTEIAWCNIGGIPKVWMAYVTANGVRKTNSWESDQ